MDFKKLLNKTSFSFLVRFVLILSVSFAVVLAVNFYALVSEPPPIEDQSAGL